MFLACDGKDIPTQWYHDPTMRDDDGNTVATHLVDNEKDVPPFWKLDKSEYERLYKSK